MPEAKPSTLRDSVFKSNGNTGSSNFPVFMQVSRDGLAFFLTEHTEDCPVGGLVHLYVKDVDAWFAEFQHRGVPVEEPPRRAFRDGDMTIVDPDGNKLRVCTRLNRTTEEAGHFN